MADILIDPTLYIDDHFRHTRGGPFWTSPTVGYVIFIEGARDLDYSKTINGGLSWSGNINIKTGTMPTLDCWADWQTPGDDGTKIHIAYIDGDTSDIRYVYLDTDGDSVGGDVQILPCQGSGTLSSTGSKDSNAVSITKTRGGNLVVAIRHTSTGPTTRHHSFYTSPDGINWTSKNAPWEADYYDNILLFPGNEGDDQDVWATYRDWSTKEIDLKTFDDSGNSWSTQLISAAMENSQGFLTMDGAIRFSDGHLIFAATDALLNVLNSLMVWDINGAGSITAKTNVFTDIDEQQQLSVFINQDNDDIYIAYLGGTDWTSLVRAVYQKSVDGGANWGGEQALQANAEDDERWISCGAVKAAWGGKFQPCWFNTDLSDLFTNIDNGILIEAAAEDGGIEHKSASMAAKMLAQGLI